MSDGTMVLPMMAFAKRDLSFSATDSSTWEKSGSKRRRRSVDSGNVDTHWKGGQREDGREMKVNVGEGQRGFCVKSLCRGAYYPLSKESKETRPCK